MDRREFTRLAEVCETADSIFCWLVGWNLLASIVYICGMVYSLPTACKQDDSYAMLVVHFLAIAAMIISPAMLHSEVNYGNFKSNLI